MYYEVHINEKVKKVAFVDGNRAINPNNVAKHVESLKEFEKNLVPLLYVDALDIKERNLYDAITNVQVPHEDYANYIVVLDGQHRYMAACELANSDEAEGFTLDALKWEKVELNGKSFEDILIEVNTRTQPWKGSDYINGCILHDPNNEVLRFAKDLTDLGISAKTVNKYLFFDDRMSWAAVMSDSTKMKEADLKRAKAIWDEVAKFPDRMRTRSIIIDYIIGKGGANYWKNELERVKALTSRQRSSFEKVKVTELKKKFENMINA